MTSKIFYPFVALARVLLGAAVLCGGCSPITYRTLYDGAKDPTFDFRPVHTIGFMPVYWSTFGKERGQDELLEKEIYTYFKAELERRGYSVTYIDPKHLEEKEKGKITTTALETFPDLTLMVAFSQKDATIEVPGQASGYISGGSGYYGSNTGYTAVYYNLVIAASLWGGPPDYMKYVWRGQILKGSPTPNLSEQAKEMVSDLMSKRFP